MVNLRRKSRRQFCQPRVSGIDSARRAVDGAIKCEQQEDKATEATDNDDAQHRGRKQVDVLIDLAADAALFHDGDRPYADIVVDDHRQTWPIDSNGFKDWLLCRYYKQEGLAPSGEALRRAIATIGARARFDGPAREVHIRVAGHAGKIYLDLCDKQWRVIEIDANGWRVIRDSPVRFRRAAGMLPLPVPVMGGSVKDLRPFVHVASDNRDEQPNPAADSDFIMLVAWLLAAYRDSGPYPGLAVMGGEGSTKSTLVRLLRSLVDPSETRERRLPREDRDLFIAAKKAHVIAFGNISSIPDWLSDSLCTLATGGGWATRALYTDEDEVLFNATRPVILNGIEFVTRSDLADRLIFLKLPWIPPKKRRTENAFWAEFEEKRPSILGAVLDVVAHGLRALPTTPIDIYPRMADFAHWIAACEGALWKPSTFSEAYAANRARANLDVIEGEAVATAVLRLMDAVEEDEWAGTASELLDRLETIVGEKEAKRKHWPGSASVLGQRLRRIASRLRKLEIKIEYEREGPKGARTITITRTGSARTGLQNSVSAVRPSGIVTQQRVLLDSSRSGAVRRAVSRK